MKKYILIIAIIFLNGIIKLYAQPQWKFHLAFEDATGAKDTFWLIWDTTATTGVDSLLGEGNVSSTIDYSVFNVYHLNQAGDTTKTYALPFTDGGMPPHYWDLTGAIYAFNYQYPMTISWDTSLFNHPDLPQSVLHARFHNAFTAFDVGYDLLSVDTFYAPPFWAGGAPGEHFPLMYHLSFNFYDGINEIDKNKCKVYPNPIENKLVIACDNEQVSNITIFNSYGQIIYTTDIKSETYYLPDLVEGFYILQVQLRKNQTYYEKLLKVRHN